MPLRRLLTRAVRRLARGRRHGERAPVIAGSAALAGRAAPVLVVGCLALVALACWARRTPPAVLPPAPAAPASSPSTPSAHPAARPGPHPVGRGVTASGPPRTPVRPSPAMPPAALPPAAGMSVEELSREWRRTAGALETGVDPTTRAQVVRPRGEVLDELERRDPAGFARWLAGGASAADYPVGHLGDSAPGPGPG